MTQMRRAINGRSANIQPNFAGDQRFKNFFLTGKCVVDLYFLNHGG